MKRVLAYLLMFVFGGLSLLAGAAQAQTPAPRGNVVRADATCCLHAPQDGYCRATLARVVEW